jgi:hypothetical protein
MDNNKCESNEYYTPVQITIHVLDISRVKAY